VVPLHRLGLKVGQGIAVSDDFGALKSLFAGRPGPDVGGDVAMRGFRGAAAPVDREIGMATPTTVDEYLATLADDRRADMDVLRKAIRAGAPEATEVMAYKMPAFRSHGGQFLVSFDAYRRHYSLFPASGAVVETLGDEIAPYLAGKGTIRFPAGQPIPAALVTKIVRIRVAENAAAERR
jgi:uncharacterized protein YdhG (YjbR/CyaY superfamily)